MCTRPTLVTMIAAALGLAAIAPSIPAQEVSESITGHVVRPKRVDATEDRLRSLKLPRGFKIARFCDTIESLKHPRMIAVADDGTIYITSRDEGRVVMLRDDNGDGHAETVRTVIDTMPMVHGIAIRNDEAFLVTIKELSVFRRSADGLLGERRLLATDLPDAGQHPNRTIAFGPDDRLYVTVGSTCNACMEHNPESATILRVLPDGRRETFARGLRNTIGFGWHPATREMWGMDHGSDWLGDDEPKEELNHLVEGADYGWPLVYDDRKINNGVDARADFDKEAYAAKTTPPDLTYTAHSAPLAMVFYTGAMFGDEYKNDAFVAMHGSWNRKPPSGYEIVRIRFDSRGRPREFEPFITGFLSGKEEFGRPAGLAALRDGSLLITDDDNGGIYRVSREGQKNRSSDRGTFGP